MSIKDRLRNVKIAQELRQLQEAGSGFQAELASETAATNVTMKAGSFFRYKVIP